MQRSATSRRRQECGGPVVVAGLSVDVVPVAGGGVPVVVVEGVAGGTCAGAALSVVGAPDGPGGAAVVVEPGRCWF